MTVTTAPPSRPVSGVNRMHPLWWVDPRATSLLDVGCNVGAFLAHCHSVFPEMRLAGVEVNPAAYEVARANVPVAELHVAGAQELPFPDSSFDCVTCIEVLEHVPEELRPAALREMHRVLKPGGRLLLRVPHAGAFSWLDPNNFRLRFPRLYRLTVGRGRRDAGYANGSEGVVWHEHFKAADLIELAGPGWEVEAIRRGGSFVFPVLETLSWPLYRLGRTDTPLFKAIQRLKNLDLGRDYGEVSEDIMLVLRRA